MKKFALLIVFLFISTACFEIPQPPSLDDFPKVSSSHDAENDQYRPVANVTVTEETGVVVQTGTKTVSNKEWNIYRVTLGEDGQSTVHFDGSASHDPDHASEADSGIATYEWKVLFDAPYGSDEFDLDGHTFSYSAEDGATNESGGFWSYSFANVTVSPSGEVENQIRVELITYDTVGRFSEKFRMYFVVQDHGSEDLEPEFQFDMALNGSQVTEDSITVNGSLISGSEYDDIYAEVAFAEEDFSASAVMKYQLSTQNLWAKTQALSNGDTFSLSLSVDDMYSNTSNMQRVYIKTYEGDDEQWATVHWMEFTLAACRGLVAPEGAIAAGGEFILDENDVCQWEGVWSYDPATGEWVEPEPQHQATFSLDVPVEPEVMENDFFFIDGTVLSSTHDETYIEVAFENSSFEASPVERYDLQLSHLWNRSGGLSVEDNFSLGLSVESLRGNTTTAYDVHVRAYVYDDGSERMLAGEDAFQIVVPYLDSDGDGVADDVDAFPTDSNETQDSDGDGVGDNADAFPTDSNETQDSDGDGVGDNADAFPTDSNETQDSDGDGVGDNADAYPNDSSIWETLDDTTTPCEEWEYWNPDQINPALPGNGCPHYEGSTDGDGSEDDGEDASLPGFEFWLSLLALLVAVRFQRKSMI